MDSFSDKSDSGVLVPPRPMVYGNMVCPVETSRDGDDASPSVTPALPCDPSVTQLPPPLTRTSDPMVSQDQVTKVRIIACTVKCLGVHSRCVISGLCSCRLATGRST